MKIMAFLFGRAEARGLGQKFDFEGLFFFFISSFFLFSFFAFSFFAFSL